MDIKVTENIINAIHEMKHQKQALYQAVLYYMTALDNAIEGILINNPDIKYKDEIRQALRQRLAICEEMRDITLETRHGSLLDSLLYEAVYNYKWKNNQ